MSRVDAFGLSVDVPAGWEARGFRHEGGEPTIHLANFTLPPSDGEFGTRATGHMREGSIFVTLTEYRLAPADLDRGIFANDIPRAVSLDAFSDRSLLLPRPGQRGHQRFFSAAGRGFCLYVVLRSQNRAGALLGAANACLRSLVVRPAP
jgi:hypothetical protein